MSLPAIIALGSLAYQMYRDSQAPKLKQTDPDSLKSELTTSPSEVRNLMSQSMRSSTQRKISALKQYGAANRLPKGTILSQIAGVGQQENESISRAMPSILAGAKGQNFNFAQLKNQFQNQQFDYQMGMHDRTNANWGALGQVAMLWSKGYLD